MSKLDDDLKVEVEMHNPLTPELSRIYQQQLLDDAVQSGVERSLSWSLAQRVAVHGADVLIAVGQALRVLGIKLRTRYEPVLPSRC